MIKGILATIAIPVTFVMVIAMNASGDGIYPIGGGAVYLAGEGCMINNTLDRSLQDMERDFEECIKYHAAHQFSTTFEGYPHFEW